MLITSNHTWERGRRKRTLKRELRVGPVSLKFITLSLLAVSALFYLAQSSQGSSQKYQIMQLTSTQQDLAAQTKDLQVEAARLKSLSVIKKSADTANLQPIDQSTFSLAPSTPK